MTDIVPRSTALRYALVRPLGRGGTAETWLARRAGGLFPEHVCIKRSLRHLNRRERRALLEEARLLARIRHSNVVQLLDVLEDEAGEVFLVLELVRGLELRPPSADVAARLLSSFTDEQRAIDELRHNLADVCPPSVIEVRDPDPG